MYKIKSTFKKLFKSNELILTPNIKNLFFFNEIDIFPESTKEIEKEILNKKLKSDAFYEDFIKKKLRRPNYDIYTCFQPFNEALKALYPFLNKIKNEVKPNEYILNLWDRNGWLTFLLSGLFPEQTIVTTWDGNKDVLGYQGFHYWMTSQKNINIVFCDLNKPLPFTDNSINYIIGYDILHRFDQLLLLNELTRIVKNDGSIIFPHVHMSNSAPKPFFERGGKQIHGKEYQSAFNIFFEDKNLEGFVFSEPELFKQNDILKSNTIKIVSDPDTNDYNGLLAILPKKWKETELSYFSLKDIQNIKTARIIVNQLLNIDLHQAKVTLDYNSFDGTMKYLMNRHPVYEKRIEKLKNYTLSELAVKVIYLAKKGFTIEQITDHLNEKQESIIHELEKLESLGLLQVLPISESGIRLQNYFMTQKFNFPLEQQTVKNLWLTACDYYADTIALISLDDESEFTYEDCNEIVSVIVSKLIASGVKKGDKIIISNSFLHVESVLLFWACMQIGIVTVMMPEHLSYENSTAIIQQTEAKYVFTNENFCLHKPEIITNIATIIFNSENENPQYNYFDEWINSNEDIQTTSEIIKPDDEAVILFTSGSTGTPKGVQLTQGNLFRSSKLIVETFHWNENDRFFTLGGLENMSGLRNSAISALHSGSAVIIPRKNSASNILSIAEDIQDSLPTILGSNPSFLRQAVAYKTKIKNQLNSIRTFICTGNNLTTKLRADFKEAYNKSIYNYYGLSETTGICIAQTYHNEITPDDNTIGKPINCIAQIVDENNNLVPIGEKGELRIFSDNLMTGYFKNPEKTKNCIKKNWFYTQDYAKYLENGTIELLGRKRNMVKKSTEEFINLTDVQTFLLNIPFINDAYATSYNTDDIEKIIAFIVLEKTEKNESNEILKKKIRQLSADNFNVKKVFNQITILSKLPYSTNGKILKKQLLNEFI